MARVFVVEDDPRLFDEVCRLLRLEGFEALGCDGFQSIAAQIVAAQPDCVLMDAMLPGCDGRMVCRELRASSDVPVIMLTCLDSEFDEVTALNLGADDYITKPYRPAVLIAHVQAALRRKKPENETVLERGGVELDVATTVARTAAPRSSSRAMRRASWRCTCARRGRALRGRTSCASCGNPTSSWTTTRSP